MPPFYNPTECFISLNGHWIHSKSVLCIHHTWLYRHTHTHTQYDLELQGFVSNIIIGIYFHYLCATPDRAQLPFFPLFPSIPDQISLVKTGGLILDCKSILELREGAACHVEPVMRSVQSMKGSWDNEETVSVWCGPGWHKLHAIRANYSTGEETVRCG